MVVSYHAATNKKVSYTTSSKGFGYDPAGGTTYDGYGGGLGMWGVGLLSRTAIPVTGVKGTLVVNIFDAKRKSLLWRGTGENKFMPFPKKLKTRFKKPSPTCLTSSLRPPNEMAFNLRWLNPSVHSNRIASILFSFISIKSNN